MSDQNVLDWDILALFPIELWEKILSFCDGKTLITLSEIHVTFENIISSLDERENIWKNRCYDEISEDDRLDFHRKLYPDETIHPRWKRIYRVWNKWKNILQGNLKPVKMKEYLWIADIKISNETIIIADKIGFSLLNSVTGESKRYKVGPVKHLELIIRPRTNRPKDAKISHDILDCTIGNFHTFFDLHRKIHLHADKHENHILRYFGQKKSKFSAPILEANVFDDLILVVNDTAIEQAVEPMHVISQYNYSWKGARSWFLWHAKLLFCAKDAVLDIYLEGRLRTFPYGMYPRITSIFYFASILFLGSSFGSLYIYRIKADDIFSFDFSQYERKFVICKRPIVAIDVIENNSKNSSIVVAADQILYRIRLDPLCEQCEPHQSSSSCNSNHTLTALS